MKTLFTSSYAVLWCCLALSAHGDDIAPQSIAGLLRPAFDLPDTQGNAVSISRWNGRIIVLNFWATWCAPCRKEIPLLNTLQQRYAKRGVQIVGVAVDNAAAVKQFMQSVPINYPVLIGDQAALEIIEAYGDRVGALPYTVFINRSGIIDSMASGALTEDYARKYLERLLENSK